MRLGSVMASDKELPEKTRNKLLRRVDWRFLSLNPWPLTSVCYAGGLLKEAVELVSGRTLAPGEASSGTCDLAVAINPDKATLGSAWNALRPGGSCYTEWYSPLVGGPKGIRRNLVTAGFEEVSCYWPWPWPSRASSQFWLPIEAPNALRYFLANRPKPASPGRYLLRLMLWTIWQLSRWANLALPLCVLARKMESKIEIAAPTGLNNEQTAYGESSKDFKSYLAATLKSGRLGPEDTSIAPSTARSFSCLLLTGGRRSINKVVGLVFTDEEEQPRLVIKMPRVPEAVSALRREAAALQAVQLQRLEGISGIPQVIFCKEYAGLLLLGETALTGLPLFTQLTAANYRELALKATDWLAGLAGKQPSRPLESWWNRLVAPVLVDFEAGFGSVIDQARLAETMQILSTLGPLPLVCEQRDFSPWNIMIAPDGNLVVLDWESAEIEGLPAMDLIYFQTYLSFFLDGAMESGRYRESYRALLDPVTRTGRVFK